MKQIVIRLTAIHLAVAVLATVIGALVWGLLGSFSAVAGSLSFSVPVVAFSFLVVRVSAGDQTRFMGRFMFAELVKWAAAAAFLAMAFVSHVFRAEALLAGFVLSVLVQVVFPIFLRKESES